MSTKSAELFVSNINKFLIWLQKSNLEYMLKYNVSKEENNQDVKKHILYGKKYIMTGFRDKLLEKTLEKIGCKSMSSISKNVDIVIVKNVDQYTYKIEQAKKLNINILSKEDFINKYDL